MSVMSIALVTFVSLFTTAVTTIVGFAVKLSLIAMLTLFLDVKDAIIIAAIFAAIVFAIRSYAFRSHIDRRTIAHATLALLPGIIVGLTIFSRIDISVLRLVFAIFLLLFVVYKLFLSNRFSFSITYRSLLIVVFFVGVLETSIGAAGPILAVGTLQYGLKKDSYVAFMSSVLCISGIIRTAGYAWYGMLPLEQLPLIAVLVVVAIAGTYLGKILMKKTPTKYFNYFVLGTLTIVAVKEIVGRL